MFRQPEPAVLLDALFLPGGGGGLPWLQDGSPRAGAIKPGGRTGGGTGNQAGAAGGEEGPGEGTQGEKALLTCVTKCLRGADVCDAGVSRRLTG